MSTKRLLALLTALVLVLTMSFTVNADIEEGKAKITVVDADVAAGGEVTVTIKGEASMSLFKFEVTYDKSLLTYVADSFADAASNKLELVSAGDGSIIFKREETSEAKYEDTAIATVKFTAVGADTFTGDEMTKTATVSVAAVDEDLGGFTEANLYDPNGGNLEGVYTNGKVTIKKAHTAPTVEASITGSGKVGEELAADVKVTDPWGLEADKAYSWKIGSTEVSTADKYTPVPADLGKDITLTVTATVEADDEPTGTGTATIKVIKNDAYKPTVTIDSKDVPEEVKDGADIVIPYAYEDGNGIADATEAKAAYADAADASDWTDLSADDVAVDTENGKVTVKTDKALVDKFVKVTVTPKNVDGDASEAKVLDPIKVIAHEVKVDVDDEDVPDNVKAGSDIVIPYTFSDDNGIADATEVTAKFADSADSSDWTDIPADSITVDPANGTITIKTSKDLAGKVLKVTVTPKNADGDASDPIDLPIIEVKNATRKSSSGGSGASLVAKDETKPVDTTTKTIVLKIGDKTVNVFGKLVENDVAPKIVADRTMMPARIVAESLGAKVDWEDATKKVTITKGSTTIIITIGAETALVNGAEVKLDSPAFIENDRTYTPMRFISENLGAKVDWDDATKTVTITPSDK